MFDALRSSRTCAHAAHGPWIHGRARGQRAGSPRSSSDPVTLTGARTCCDTVSTERPIPHDTHVRPDATPPTSHVPGRERDAVSVRVACWSGAL